MMHLLLLFSLWRGKRNKMG